MAFLFAGLALGAATAIALSPPERDRYYSTRGALTFLGQKQGVDVFHDRVTGVYYVDDGWEVRRIGKPGWHAHPVDKARLEQILQKHRPAELRWVDLSLAMYAGKEYDLWKKLYFRFERPKKPKKPTTVFTESFTKKVRKERYASYEEMLERYNAARDKADAKFKEDNRMWSARKAEYDRSHAQPQGRVLLKSALASSATQNVSVRIRIPEGKSPGAPLDLFYKNRQYRVQVPSGAVPGQEVTVVIPEPVDVAVAYTPPVQVQGQPVGQPTVPGAPVAAPVSALSHGQGTSQANGLSSVPSAPPLGAGFQPNNNQSRANFATAAPASNTGSSRNVGGLNAPGSSTVGATVGSNSNNNNALPRVNSFDFI